MNPPPTMTDDGGRRVPVVLAQPAALVVEINVRLFVELNSMSRAEQIEVLRGVGGYIADRLERMAKR